MVNRIQQFKDVQNTSQELFSEALSKFGNISNLISFRNKINKSIQISELSIVITNKLFIRQDLLNLHNCSAQTYMSITNITDIKLLHSQALDLFTQKNNDYGDAFAINGIVGILIRIIDKLSRLETLCNDDSKRKVDDESIEDTVIDVYNYSTMALMLLFDNNKCNHK